MPQNDTTIRGYGILFVPMSWAFGRWDITEHKREGIILSITSVPKKTLWALGPFRFVVHYNLGAWKQ